MSRHIVPRSTREAASGAGGEGTEGQRIEAHKTGVGAPLRGVGYAIGSIGGADDGWFQNS